MHTILIRWFREWARPAFGATAPGIAVYRGLFRWALALLFLALAANGSFGPWRPMLIAAVVAVPVVLALGDAIHLTVRHRQESVLAAYPLFYLSHVVLVAIVSAADPSPNSLVPVLSILTIFTAQGVYSPRFIASLGFFAAASTLGAQALRSGYADLSLVPTIFWSTILPAAGVYAAMTAARAEGLRRGLSAANAASRAQADSLREALAMARENELRFRTFADHAPALISLLDRAGSLIYTNHHLREELGTDLRLEEGAIASAALPPESRRRLREGVRRATAGRTAFVDFETTAQRSMKATLFPISDGAGVMVFDITAERAHAVQDSRAQQMETLGTLAGGVAHDFNNLLTSILGNIYMVRRGLPAGSALLGEMLDDARIAGERGAELVRRLMDYSRPQLEEPDLVAIDDLVGETVRLAAPGLTPLIRVTIEPPAPDLLVTGSFGALQQVLLNLLLNARDAMPEGGAITIRSSWVTADDPWIVREFGIDSGPFVAVTVTDTGYGMAPDVAARVFEPFFTTKEMGKGTGLGLPTAASIARAHGGRIDVFSAPGAGTTFRLVLPRARVDTTAAPREQPLVNA